MEKKETQVLAELMQFGYDRSFIASTHMKGDEELETMLGELSRKVIDACWEWFHTVSQVKDDNVRHKTIMRFCLTAGIGAAWLWEKQREDVSRAGLFELMIEPRMFRKMDEYIEDIVGIWYSQDSIDHNRLRCLNYGCMDILQHHYDLQNLEQEYIAGYLLCIFGMYCGRTRLYHEETVAPHSGRYENHTEVWDCIHGEDTDYKEFREWSIKAIRSGQSGHAIEVISNDESTEFAKKATFFYSCTYNEQAGIKTLAYQNEQGEIEIMTSTPIFDTSRNYLLILDKVYVWKNGAEATIKAHFPDDDDFEVVFYDTHYLENKDKYFGGRKYIFDLYGVAYNAHIVPEDKRSFSFEGEDAISFNQKLGRETELDADGNPLPVNFNLKNLHSFFQIEDEFPEDAEFQSPIKAVYGYVDYLGKKVYEVEIGMPDHNHGKEEKPHPLSVYISSDNFSESPSKDTPIKGIIYLQGRMRHAINYDEVPSTRLHTFSAKKPDGTDSVFVHSCPEEEVGQPMNEEERHQFAIQVCMEQTKARHFDKRNESDPDLRNDRRRCFWVNADSCYSAEESFQGEDKVKYLSQCYSFNRNPIIAYVSLYDQNGKECQWLKGRSYTAKIHYGSVRPGQKMDIDRILSHEELIQRLYDSYKNFDTCYVDRWLHKDLDFQSVNLDDPIITRDEYIQRSENINRNNKKSENGHMVPTLHISKEQGAYIEMNYPEGNADYVRIKTENGFITDIRIDNKLFEL